MFKRQHHQRIAMVLQALDSQLLMQNNCLFGGGTAIALKQDEYRESVDIDFLISDLKGYRLLREQLKHSNKIETIFKHHNVNIVQIKDIRTDQYGIRALLNVMDKPIKFEIIFEARITLDHPKDTDQILGISTLKVIDMAASKLLANSDRWNDASTFNRDIIDLAMLELSPQQFCNAVAKAENAYGRAIINDLTAAFNRLKNDQQWLERCMQALSITMPQALLWKKLRAININNAI